MGGLESKGPLKNKYLCPKFHIPKRISVTQDHVPLLAVLQSLYIMSHKPFHVTFISVISHAERSVTGPFFIDSDGW
jgi:hypothetical protein